MLKLRKVLEAVTFDALYTKMREMGVSLIQSGDSRDLVWFGWNKNAVRHSGYPEGVRFTPRVLNTQRKELKDWINKYADEVAYIFDVDDISTIETRLNAFIAKHQKELLTSTSTSSMSSSTSTTTITGFSATFN